MGLVVERFSVYLVSLDPTIGSEIKKTRPCVVISPNSLNKNLSLSIVAPLTSTARNWPTRVNTKFQGKDGQIILEQIRSISHSRIIKKLGKVDSKTSNQILEKLSELFAK